MDTTPIRHEALLLKDGLRNCILDSDPRGDKYSLYESKDKTSFCKEARKIENEHVQFFCDLMDEIPDTDFSSENLALFVTKNERKAYEISLRVSLSQLLVENLSKVFVQPEFSVQGQYLFYLVSRLEDDTVHSTWKNFKLSVPLLSFGHKVSCQFHASDRIRLPVYIPYNMNNIQKWGLNLKLQYKVAFTWTRFGRSNQNNKTAIMEKLLQEKLLADCVIVAKNGEEVSCHRNIIAAQSDAFHATLESLLDQPLPNRIEMPEVSEKGVTLLITYFYQNKLDTEQLGDELGLQLFQAAHQYNISSLVEILMDFLCTQPSNWFSQKSVIMLYLFTFNVEQYQILRDKMKRILRRDVTQFRDSEYFQEFLQKYPKEVANLEFA